jgi:branched-chain amino acid transport system ATP-binding protein
VKPDPATWLLEAQGLHAWYGSSHVLRGVDIAVAGGETVGLLGRNGMGKTTLIRTLLGHVKQRQGQIHVGGHDFSRGAPHQVARAGVAYVPEGRGVFPNLTVRENLVMAASTGAHGEDRWKLAGVLELFPRLAERLTHLGSQLSGGEQQMLAIGRALLTNPRLIILDEATEGLAPQIVAEIWRIVEALRAQGLAALIVDRNHHRVAQHSDRLVVLQKGQVVLEGRSAALRGGEELARYLGV